MVPRHALGRSRRNGHGSRGPIAPGVDCIAPGNERWYPRSVSYYFWEQSIACLGAWNLGVKNIHEAYGTDGDMICAGPT